MERALLLVLVAGCGRVGFDTASLASGDARDAQPPACGRLFCDGFEDVGLAAWHGSQQDAGTTVERVAEFGRVGASLRAAGPVGTNIAAKYVDVFAATGADAWMRVYLFARSGTVLDVEAITLADPMRKHELVLSLYDDSVDLHAHGIAGDFEVTLVEPPPRERWVCWELHVVLGSAGSVELYRDGMSVLQKASLDIVPTAGELSRLLVGITSKPPMLEQEVFVDDVVADVARIGCE